MNGLIFHNFPSAPRPVAPFSHAVECDGWIQLTGQMPTYPNDDLKSLPNGIKAQTRRVMDNLSIVLHELDLGIEFVLSTRIYLIEFERDYKIMNSIYESYFQPGRLPARRGARGEPSSSRARGCGGGEPP